MDKRAEHWDPLKNNAISEILSTGYISSDSKRLKKLYNSVDRTTCPLRHFSFIILIYSFFIEREFSFYTKNGSK